MCLKQVLTVHEPPVEQGVVDKGLQDGHDAVPVLPQHLHHGVAGDPVVPIQTCHLNTHNADAEKNKSSFKAKVFIVTEKMF